MRARAALVLGALVTLLAVLLVPISSVSAVDADQSPVVEAASATPTSVPATGGVVHVQARVGDDHGLSQVTVFWYENSQLRGQRDLAVARDTGADGGMSGTDSIASGDVELAPTDAEHEFQFVIVARDDFREQGIEGQSTTAVAGFVTQQAPPAGAPVVSDVSVTPRTLPAEGGKVTIRATLDDARASAVATVSGVSSEIALEATEDGAVEGVFDAPANRGTSERTYDLTVTATGADGAEASTDAGTVTVAAAVPELLLPDTVAFGPIEVGTAGLYGFVLKNPADPDSAPVEGTMTVDSDDYAFAGTDARTVSYSLRGGESTTVALTFRPAELGPREGTIDVTRADADTTQSVDLTGSGT